MKNMIVNNAKESDPKVYNNKVQYFNVLNKKKEEAKKEYFNNYGESTINEYHSYIKAVEQKFKVEHTYKTLDPEDYLGIGNIIRLAEEILDEPIKPKVLKARVLNGEIKLTKVNITEQWLEKAYELSSPLSDFIHILDSLCKNPITSNKLHIDSYKYFYENFKASITSKQGSLKVRDFISKLRKYKIEIDKIVANSSSNQDVQQFQELPYSCSCWEILSIKLKKQGKTYPQIASLFIEKGIKNKKGNTISSDAIRKHLERNGQNVTQKGIIAI